MPVFWCYFGFYAVLTGFSGQYEWAAMAIFAAMIFDGLDGRVARMTNTQSDFGVQYDSLSDMVSFGVAPAVVAYGWGINNLGKVGLAAAFVYASCAALRLASNWLLLPCAWVPPSVFVGAVGVGALLRCGHLI